MNTLRDNLRYLSDTQGANRKAQSKEAGLNETALRDILNGRSKSPRMDTLEKLAHHFGVEIDDLLNKDLTESREKIYGESTKENVATESPHPAPTMPGRTEMPRDVPVYGTVAGAVTGAMQLDHENIVDHVRRPPGIAGAKDVYGLYVVGDSMEPRYFEGDLIYVHPGRPVRVGDFVVVQTQSHDHEPPQAYVKRLLRRSSKSVVLGWLNPVDVKTEIPLKFIVSIHRVLTTNDLMGV